MRAALVFLPMLLVACAAFGNAPASVLPVDAHAKPTAREVDEHPCRYGDAPRCIAKCEGGDPQGCNGAGVLFEFSETPDPLMASSFYGRACDANYGPGCDNLAWLYLHGRGVPRDLPHAMALFMAAFDAASLACGRGDGAGCLLAGEMLRDGRGVEEDAAQALAMFQRACASGERRGCELQAAPQGYFDAPWAMPFDPKATASALFTRADGSTVGADMMSARTTNFLRHAEGPTWEAIEIPYAGESTSMVVVLPRPGQFTAVEQGLTGDFVNSLQPSSEVNLQITLPKFTVHGPVMNLTPSCRRSGWSMRSPTARTSRPWRRRP